jgi:hypothetical protein
MRLFGIRPEGNVTIVPMRRNESCFCGSGLKYKKCHALKLQHQNKIACRIVDNQTGKTKIKILKGNSLKVKSKLRWVDIGVGTGGKIE